MQSGFKQGEGQGEYVFMLGRKNRLSFSKGWRCSIAVIADALEKAFPNE